MTENIIGADPVRVIEVLDSLRNLGVTLSLDDFGTRNVSDTGLLARTSRELTSTRNGRTAVSIGSAGS